MGSGLDAGGRSATLSRGRAQSTPWTKCAWLLAHVPRCQKLALCVASSMPRGEPSVLRTAEGSCCVVGTSSFLNGSPLHFVVLPSRHDGARVRSALQVPRAVGRLPWGPLLQVRTSMLRIGTSWKPTGSYRNPVQESAVITPDDRAPGPLGIPSIRLGDLSFSSRWHRRARC